VRPVEYNKERENLKDKFNEPESNNKNKNTIDMYRSINEFKKGINLQLIL
jgi:hypothetical protein